MRLVAAGVSLLLALSACGQSAQDESDDIVVSAEEPDMVEQVPSFDPMPTDPPTYEAGDGYEAAGEAAEETDAEAGGPDDPPQPDGL